MAQGVPAQLQAAAQLQQSVAQGQAATAQNPNAAAQQTQPNPQQLAAAAAANNPYPGYNLASLAGIDMSGFQNAIDWSSMYGMNMYV